MNASSNISGRFSSVAGFLPHSIGAVLALLSVGGVMAYSVSQQQAVGRVHGRVVLSDGLKPLANVRVTLLPSDDNLDSPTVDSEGTGKGVTRIRTRTNANGEFEVSQVPIGFYRVSASTHAHSTKEQSLLVVEDEATQVSLRLNRSQPDLQVTQQQTDFLPTDMVTLPVHGYVDGQKGTGADTLQLRVFRTRLSDILRDPKATSALAQVTNRYSPISALPPALLHPVSATAPQLIDSQTVPISGADIEGFYHQRLKLGNLGPGVYLVDVAHGKKRVCAQLMVSDTALVVKKTPEQVLAYTVDSRTGAPRANAAIQLFKGGKTIGTAKSDAQGLARIKLGKPGEDEQEESDERLLTLASFNGNEATVGQYDYSGDGDEEHGDYTVHAYTDRPIYRPGASVSYKGIARRKLDTGARYSVPVNLPVEVEIRDPSGGRVGQAHLTTNRYGAFHGSVDISPEAPTGSYSIVMSIDGEEHTSDFIVASYRKPEFSATVTPNEKHYAFGDTVEMMVDSTYYFGAPVAGGKVHYTVSRSPDWSSYYGDEYEPDEADYPEEEAEDESSSDGEYSDYSGEIVQEGDVVLDGNGHAIIRFPGQKKGEGDQEEDSDEDTSSESYWDEPQDQIYTVDIYVTDAAEREVEASGEVPVTAGNIRLSARTEGYFAAPGQTTTVSVKASDFNDKPVPNSPVTLNCSYRKWDEDNEQWQDIDTRTFNGTTDAKGIAQINIKVPREGELYLTAQTQDDQKRTVAANTSLWISGDAGGDYDAQYSDLSLLTDKKSYNSGQVAKVLVNTQQSGGTALLTVEGSKLFRAWLVPLVHKSTAIQVPIGADYGPNITLSACTVRDKKFARSEAPLRVVVPQQRVKVSIQSDRQKYQPGDEVTYRVQTTDNQGKPISTDLSFGVVDESIYALQEDDPGALRAAFYPHNPNNVQTSYSFEPLYLGDVNKAEPEINARTKFMDTAYWQPDIETDAKGLATVSFKLPDNLTTWRATAVAQTLDTAFGRKIQKVVVAKDFFVRLDTPRFFTGGDNTQLTALVHNETGSDQDATVKLVAEGLSLSGEETQTVHIASGKVGQVIWPVSPDSAGLNFANLAHLKLTAWTPNNGGKQFTDGIESNVPVRAHGREHIDNFVGHLKGGSTLTQPLVIDSSAIPSASQVTVRITPSISDALVGGLRYLVGFPYGCTEQTMSRFLPDILVQRTLRLKGARDPEAQKINRKLPEMVRNGLTRLSRFQHESGGWGWWETDEDDAWMTAYVLYGLSQAKTEGYGVDSDMISRGREAATEMLKNPKKQLPTWQQSNWENTRAFLMYALAISQPTADQFKVLRAQRTAFQTTGLDAQAVGYTILLDKQLGLPDTVTPQLDSQMQSDGEHMSYWKGSGYYEWSDWDDKTATAVGLRVLVANNPEDPRIDDVLLWLMANREDNYWGNTRDTAWILSALCDYINAGGIKDSNAPGAIKVSVNNKELQNYTLNPGQSKGELVLRIPWQSVSAARNTLKLQRIGGGEPIFYSVQLKQTVASDKPLPAYSWSVPINIKREYRRLIPKAAGSDSWEIKSEPTNNKLKQGDRIRVKLDFFVPRDMSYVLIEDAFPAGCEVTQRGTADESMDDWNYWWSNTDVRDDRIAFFARHLTKGKHTIEYNLRAQTPGTYNALPTMLQAMYDTNVRAESGETQVTID